MAASVQFQIKRGKKQDLPLAEKILGCWYLTTDTHEVFICNDGTTLEPLISGGVATFKSPRDLPLVGKETIVYFIVDDAGTSIYRWVNDNGGSYNKVLDGTLTVKVINGGSSIDPEAQLE